MKLSDFSPVNLWAIGAIGLLAAAGVAYHVGVVSRLEVKVASAQKATAEAQGKLEGRVAAEATTVAAAVSKALKDERAARADQQERYDELKKSAATDAANLAVARSRLRDLAAASAASRPGSGDLPEAAAAAGRVQGAVPGGLPAADRKLIDELLQIASDANADARARNFISQQYQVNCERKDVQ